jgi:hypothetical protein
MRCKVRLTNSKVGFLVNVSTLAREYLLELGVQLFSSYS